MVLKLSGKLLASVVLLSLFVVPAAAQEAGDHAAHHPAGSAAGTAVPGMGGAPASASATGSMMDDMDDEDEGEHGADRSPFMSRLLGATALRAEDHGRLIADANRRIERGHALIADAMARTGAGDAQSRFEAGRRMREGAELFTSGSAALAALQSPAGSEDTGINWFREQMGLVPLSQEESVHWLGLSPAHFMLMLFLVVVSVLLIGLQMARLRRIGKLVGVAAGPGLAAKGGAFLASRAPASQRVINGHSE